VSFDVYPAKFGGVWTFCTHFFLNGSVFKKIGTPFPFRSRWVSSSKICYVVCSYVVSSVSKEIWSCVVGRGGFGPEWDLSVHREARQSETEILSTWVSALPAFAQFVCVLTTHLLQRGWQTLDGHFATSPSAEPTDVVVFVIFYSAHAAFLT